MGVPYPFIWNTSGSGGGGGGGNNQTLTFQTDAGTYPVLNTASSTLTFTSSDLSVSITGNSATDTIDLIAAGGGSGTVTSVSVVSANGLAGTVATATTTPAITLTTSITGLLKGNGTAISAATAGTDYLTGTLSDGNILVGNGSNVATSVNPSGDIDISNAGVFSIASGAIVNADVNASAAIDYSKLATLTAGNIVLGNVSNVATSTAVTGDVTISDAGVTAIASGVIVNADINGSAAIDATKIADGSVTSAEFQYLGDVTSLIQAQLNNKQAVGSYITDLTGDVVATGPGSVSATIQANAVSSAKFRQSVAVSVVGRSANSTGDVADIAAGSNGQFLARASNALSFVTPASTDISDFTEAAQDVVGAMASSSDFQYTDATPLLSAKKTVEIKVFDDSTTLTTGDGKYYWIVPSQFNARVIIGVFATVTTVSSSGTPTVQIHNLTDAVDVLSTALTIDVSEYTSDTAATPAVINTSNDDLATGDRIRIDVDVAGTGAKGLSVGIIIGV